MHFVANQKPFLTDLNHDISLNEQQISRKILKKVVLSEEMKNIKMDDDMNKSDSEIFINYEITTSSISYAQEQRHNDIMKHLHHL